MRIWVIGCLFQSLNKILSIFWVYTPQGPLSNTLQREKKFLKNQIFDLMAQPYLFSSFCQEKQWVWGFCLTEANITCLPEIIAPLIIYYDYMI